MNEQQIHKIEKIELNQKYEKLMISLNKKSSLFDERLIRKVGNEQGFSSKDNKVYKLLSLVSENMFDELLTSINHKNSRDIEMISKKILDAKNDDSKCNKKCPTRRGRICIIM